MENFIFLQWFYLKFDQNVTSADGNWSDLMLPGKALLLCSWFWRYRLSVENLDQGYWGSAIYYFIEFTSLSNQK